MPALAGELDERQRADHRRVEAGTRTSRRARRPPTRARCAGAPRTRGRCASVSRSVSSAVPEPITATARSCQRRVRYSVITSSGFVTTIATRGSAPASTAVATESITATFWCRTSRRLSPGVVWWPAVMTRMSSRSISSIERPRTSMRDSNGRACMKSSARPAGGGAVAAVDRDPTGEPAHDERGRGRDPDATDPDDAHRQSSHRRTVARRTPPARSALPVAGRETTRGISRRPRTRARRRVRSGRACSRCRDRSARW